MSATECFGTTIINGHIPTVVVKAFPEWSFRLFNVHTVLLNNDGLNVYPQKLTCFIWWDPLWNLVHSTLELTALIRAAMQTIWRIHRSRHQSKASMMPDNRHISGSESTLCWVETARELEPIRVKTRQNSIKWVTASSPTRLAGNTDAVKYTVKVQGT